MGPPSIWATLGIEATRDRAVIRRAYAARLKATNPEDDPAGFQALRAAYERALAWAAPAATPARRGAAREPEPEPPRGMETQATGGPTPSDAEAAPDTAETPKERARDWRPPEATGAPAPPERVRDWRAPQRAEAPPPRRRIPAWRPPQPPPEIFDDAARRDYAARRETLAGLVADAAASPAARQAALAALLASPLLEDMSRHAEAERWLARLIAANPPRSDALIAPAIAHFGWDVQRVGPRSDVAAAVLARREDLRFLEAARGIGAPHPGAVRALTRKPTRWTVAVHRLSPALAGHVRSFLAVVRAERPGLMTSLDAGAVAWWDAHLARPRLGPLAIWTLAVLPVLVALGAWKGEGATAGDDSPLVFGLATLGAVSATVLFNLYAVQWPRELWRRRWARTAPAWAGLAWAPALLGAVLLAAALPPSAPATLALLGAAALSTLWAVVVGEPDRRQPGQAIPAFRWRGPILSVPIAFFVYLGYWVFLRSGVRWSWPLRAAFAFTYLAAFWLAAIDDLAPAAALQMTGPLIAAAIAFSLSAGTLATAWARASARGRRNWLIGLAGLALAALAALWAARDVAAARPLAAALIAAAVFAHKAPGAALAGAGATVRDLVMRVGWLGLVWVAANLADLRANWVAALVILGIAGLVALIVTLERADRAQPIRRRLARTGEATLRYGWLALTPVLLALIAGPDTSALATAGVWMLCGVGATLAALAPSPRPARGRI